MYNPTKPYKKKIFELIKKTWNNPNISVRKDIYSVFRKRFNSPEIDHTDGIGSKGVYHWQKRSFHNAVIDAMAMNLNDLALMRAKPYKLQNHITLPEDDQKAILEIIKNLSDECKKRKIAITGGETSIHSNIEGMDLAITMSGIIEKGKPNQILASDVLIGFKSTGLHSNGFSKVRQLFKNKFRKEFIEPTAIYLETILDLDKKYDVHGMMHITGGAFTKLKDIVKNIDLEIWKNHNLKPQNIFQDIFAKGLSDEEMYKTFNCGIGFIISTSENDGKEIINKYPKLVDIIGIAKPGNGKISIQSAFSNTIVNF